LRCPKNQYLLQNQTAMNTKNMNPERIKGSIIPVLLLTAMLIIPLQEIASNPPAKKLNISGTWVLNDSRSNFGEYGQMWASRKLVIVHKRKDLSIERSSSDMDGQLYTVQETYTIDGEECENPVMDESKKISTVSLSDDKSSLVIKSTLYLSFEGQEMQIGTVETYSLGEDGKSLVIDGTSSTDFGDMVVKFVYDLE
jgi:hypothetical protein